MKKLIARLFIFSLFILFVYAQHAFRVNQEGNVGIGTKPGLDVNFKPVFYADENNTILKGDYRFKKSDFEKNTILVPDISEIQEGDLILKYM